MGRMEPKAVWFLGLEVLENKLQIHCKLSLYPSGVERFFFHKDTLWIKNVHGSSTCCIPSSEYIRSAHVKDVSRNSSLLVRSNVSVHQEWILSKFLYKSVLEDEMLG